MKQKVFVLFYFLSVSFFCLAQEKINRDENKALPQDGILVYQGHFSVPSTGINLSFAYAKGDLIQINCITKKNKKIKLVKFQTLMGSVIWRLDKPASFSKEARITKDGVYTLQLLSKGLVSRNVEIEIIRKPGNQKDYNTAWMAYRNYQVREIKYSIDSVVGFKAPVVSEKEFKVFDKYLYKNIEFVNYKSQILAQMGIHNSQAKPFKLGIDQTKVPKNGKLKGYTYSLSSVMGGKKHWVIADISVSVGAMFLSPLGGFVAHGAMAVIGPQPGNEPIQYFLTDHESDLKIVREIYSPHNDARKATNLYKDGVGEVVGLFSGSAKKAVKGTKVHEYNEGELHYNQKGKVTNMLVFSAKPPSKDLMILANPDYTHAKNIKLSGSAIYYAPTYKKLMAKEYFYELEKQQVSKVKKQYSRTVSYSTIID